MTRLDWEKAKARDAVRQPMTPSSPSRRGHGTCRSCKKLTPYTGLGWEGSCRRCWDRSNRLARVRGQA